MNRQAAQPLVSCLMVTRDRPIHAALAADCFVRQTHPACELVIVDDGAIDYGPFLPTGDARHRIRYIRIDDGVPRMLGDMRNLSLDLAEGDWWIQWDDDEWYHPTRVEVQLAAAMADRTNGCALRWTLMHVESLGAALFRADAGFATPGTLLHRRTAHRYHPLARGEDSAYLREARRSAQLTVLGRQHSHLFVRRFHGANTWNEHHFLRRLRRRPADWPSWLHARAHGDLLRHRAFRLDAREAQAAAALLADLADHESLVRARV